MRAAVQHAAMEGSYLLPTLLYHLLFLHASRLVAGPFPWEAREAVHLKSDLGRNTNFFTVSISVEIVSSSLMAVKSAMEVSSRTGW